MKVPKIEDSQRKKYVILSRLTTHAAGLTIRRNPYDYGYGKEKTSIKTSSARNSSRPIRSSTGNVTKRVRKLPCNKHRSQEQVVCEAIDISHKTGSS